MSLPKTRHLGSDTKVFLKGLDYSVSLSVIQLGVSTLSHADSRLHKAHEACTVLLLALLDLHESLVKAYSQSSALQSLLFQEKLMPWNSPRLVRPAPLPAVPSALDTTILS